MLTIPFITGGCSSEPKVLNANLAFKAEATTGEGSIWHPDILGGYRRQNII